MPRTGIQSSAQRKIGRDGVPITLVHYDRVEHGSRGSTWQEAAKEDVSAYPDFGGSSVSYDAQPTGAEINIDAVFYVLRRDISDEYLTEGGHDGASRVEYRNRRYIVERVEDRGQTVLALETTLDDG